MGYAIWLVPAEQQARELEKLMQLRPPSASNATNSRSYPTFHPHVTLAAFDAEPAGLQAALETLAAEREPVVSYFLKLVAGDSYLGAMKVQLEKTPGLVQLHARVTDVLHAHDITWRSRGFPHLSLFYVDGAEERQRLAAHIGGADVVLRKRDSSRIMLRAGPRGRPLRRLIGAGMWLVDCRGAVEKWQVLAKWQLSNECESAALIAVKAEEAAEALSFPAAHTDNAEPQLPATGSQETAAFIEGLKRPLEPVAASLESSAPVRALGTADVAPAPEFDLQRGLLVVLAVAVAVIGPIALSRAVL